MQIKSDTSILILVYPSDSLVQSDLKTIAALLPKMSKCTTIYMSLPAPAPATMDSGIAMSTAGT